MSLVLTPIIGYYPSIIRIFGVHRDATGVTVELMSLVTPVIQI